MPTLMIVDDSNIIRNHIERIQESQQFKIVAKAKNGVEAVEFCQKLKPEIVTMDLTMPKMDGLECIPILKKLHPEIKILVVSALTDKATAIRAMKYGAKGFLSKPFTDEELTHALSRLVEKK